MVVGYQLIQSLELSSLISAMRLKLQLRALFGQLFIESKHQLRETAIQFLFLWAFPWIWKSQRSDHLSPRVFDRWDVKKMASRPLKQLCLVFLIPGGTVWENQCCASGYEAINTLDSSGTAPSRSSITLRKANNMWYLVWHNAKELYKYIAQGCEVVRSLPVALSK